MGNGSHRSILTLLGFVAALAIPVGCGGGGDGGPGDACAAPTVTAAQVDGVWRVVESEVSNTCGDPTPPDDTEDVTVTLVGSTLTVVSSGGTENFTICGNTFTIGEDTEVDVDGTTVTAPATVTINGSAGTLSATGTWVFTPVGGGASCTGTYTLTGTKL